MTGIGPILSHPDRGMDRIRRIIVQILERLIGLIFIAISGITLAQVFCRYVLRFSLTWSHELVVLLFIWIVWLCIPVGLDRQSHLCMTILQDKVSSSTRLWLTRLSWVLTIFFMLLVFFLTFPVLKAFEGILLTTLPLSVQTHYYANVIGSFLSIFILLSHFSQSVEKR
jgi:TRAP-type C4-dicarboxylate transport system permease small subunit